MTEEDKVKRDVEVMNNQVGRLEGYDCLNCRNKGVIYKGVQKEFLGTKSWEVVSSECECIKLRSELNRIRNSGLEKLMKRYTFENYKTFDDWQNYIKSEGHKYANNPDGWFYIGGQPGCGKTHICTAIVGKMLKDGKVAKYMLWQDDITTLKQIINDVNFYNELMKEYKTADILYIDDFFKTRRGDFVSTADVNMTFKIINHRYNKELLTIISSELSLEQITEIDEALGSRIAEMAKEHKIYIRNDPFKNYRFRGEGYAD